MTSEHIPLCDSVTHPLAKGLEFAFGCHHTKLSRVFTIDGPATRLAAIVEQPSTIPAEAVASTSPPDIPGTETPAGKAQVEKVDAALENRRR